jgi:hypothetical protein
MEKLQDDLNQILEKLELDINKAEQLKREEDDSFYDVWKVISNDKEYILKRTDELEILNYENYLSKLNRGVPKLYKKINYNNKWYILIDYFKGDNLCKATKENLKKVLDELIRIQDIYWNSPIDKQYNQSLESRINRGKYLKNELINSEYQKFLSFYKQTPLTLCHDDLLPFNVLCNDDNACLIDWGHAGILPYPTPIVRLIAHGKDDEEYLFYMKEEDKEFVINYYYDNFIKNKNIDYDTYINIINYFLLYEYCVWIMLGEKHNNLDSDMYKEYCNKALTHINNKLLK